MSDRFERMDSFIKNISRMVEENPDLDLDDKRFHNIVYLDLVYRDVTDFDSDYAQSGMFGRLFSYFNDRRNLSIYRDHKCDYFLQLQNNLEEFYNNKDAIKIYIPQKSASIERSARLLFDFLDKLNIAHTSKIAKRERIDNIVVRLYNQNDAEKVLNFVRGNSQIQSGLIKDNPFSYSVDNISLSFDRDNCYNSIIVDLICTYMRYVRENNSFDKVNVQDFIRFSQEYYINHFTNLNDIGEVVTDFKLEGKEINNTFNNKSIVNIGNVLHLFLRGLNNDFNLDEFYQSFNYVNNEAHIISAANEIEKKRDNLEDLKSSNHLGAIDALFLDAVDLLVKKYNTNSHEALKIIEEYMNSNNQYLITRDGDLRKKFIKNNMSSKLKRLTEINGCSLDTYYRLKYQVRAMNAVNDAIFETYSKYESCYTGADGQIDGTTQAVSALFRYVNTGNVTMFTRDNNSRANLVRFSNSDAVLDVLDKGRFEEGGDKDFDLFNRCSEYVKKVIQDRRKVETKEETKVYKL